jgi:excisionase family DNA binding protein
MPLLKLAEAANQLGVSIYTIHQWRRSGKIKAERVGTSGKYRYDVEKLDVARNLVAEKRGAIYARVSTSKQEPFLKNQIERLTAQLN